MSNAIQQRLSRLQALLNAERASVNSSKLYIMDLLDSIEDCQVKIGRLKLIEGKHYEMVAE